ncbi:MAG TPA: hypothetical protein VI792_08000 [Candidatus Eisenbacteria bacterium]
MISTATATPTATPTPTAIPTPTATPIATADDDVPTGPAVHRQGRWRPTENLLVGPTRCLLRYLEAVRQAGPRPQQPSGRLAVPKERDYAAARALTAPRTLEEIDRRAAAGDEHPLAPWRAAARAQVLESFQLVAVRRAPQGAAVVTVAENFWRPPGAELERIVSEYLVARVHGEWKIVDRSPGQAFDDDTLRDAYAGFFDAPASTR